MTEPLRLKPLPRFVAPRRKFGPAQWFALPGAPWVLALFFATPFALTVGEFADVHPVAAFAMGALLTAHLGAVLNARRRHHCWLGWGGLLFTILVFVATAIGAGPARRPDAALEFFRNFNTVTDQSVWLDGLRVIMSNVLPWFAAVGGYLSSYLRISEFPPR